MNLSLFTFSQNSCCASVADVAVLAGAVGAAVLLVIFALVAAFLVLRYRYLHLSEFSLQNFACCLFEKLQSLFFAHNG